MQGIDDRRSTALERKDSGARTVKVAWRRFNDAEGVTRGGSQLDKEGRRCPEAADDESRRCEGVLPSIVSGDDDNGARRRP